MTRYYAIIQLILINCLLAASAQEPLRLRYDHPATNWTEALPIGNGRLGAMIYGDPRQERIQFNEDTLTSDEPGYRTLPLDVRKDFAAVRELIASRKFAEADVLVTRKWLGRSWACYQPMGDLRMVFDHGGTIQNYRRELSLDDATCRIQYECDGVKFQREILASHPDEVIAMRLTANQPGRINFQVRLTSPHPTARFQVDAAAKSIAMSGQAPGMVVRRTLDWIEKQGETWKYPELFGADGKRRPQAKQILYGDEIGGRGMFFNARLRVQTTGGVVTETNGMISVRGADEAIILLSAATSFNGFDKSPSREGVDASAKANAFLEVASRRQFPELVSRHLADFRRLFNRVSLRLGDSGSQRDMPTDLRVKQFGNGKDPSLVALYFQYGRYLMIAGSRPGGQPLNLQGMWNEEVIPPWASGYTININTEMNYWPAEIANLSECTEPLLRLIRELAVDGRRVARDMYGCRGWVAHHNTTLWRCAQPVDFQARTAFWPMGGAWLCRHLSEHFAFTGDREFLKNDAYPLLKGACEFYLDWLVFDADGKLITPVGTSPENQFAYTDQNGKETRAAVSAGVAMDTAIIRDLFKQTLSVARIIGTDPAFQDELTAALAKLRPYQIGSKGQLLEWAEEFREPEPHHRHISQIYGLYPGDEITPDGTPALAAAARRTLEMRGEGGTGWSMAWKINLQARLKDSEAASRMLSNLITESTLPNLLDTCPPFQIDGNFGGCAGIAEMLLQSHKGFIQILPACPKAWSQGQFKGLMTRGGFEVSATWEKGRLQNVQITSHQGGDCLLQLQDSAGWKFGDTNAPVQITSNGLLKFATKAGQQFVLTR
jgi:alpha-L-fucosidase 2